MTLTTSKNSSTKNFQFYFDKTKSPWLSSKRPRLFKDDFYSTPFRGRVYKWKICLAVCLSIYLSVITSYSFPSSDSKPRRVTQTLPRYPMTPIHVSHVKFFPSLFNSKLTRLAHLLSFASLFFSGGGALFMVVFYWWILSLVKQGWWWPSKVTMITRFARARTLFWSIYRPRDLSTAVLQGSFYLANMTRYKYIPIGRKLPGQKISAAYSLGIIPKMYFSLSKLIFLIFLKDTLDIRLPQGGGLIFQQKGMLHAGLGENFKHSLKITKIYLLNIILYNRRCLSSLPCGNVGNLLLILGHFRPLKILTNENFTVPRKIQLLDALASLRPMMEINSLID